MIQNLLTSSPYGMKVQKCVLRSSCQGTSIRSILFCQRFKMNEKFFLQVFRKFIEKLNSQAPVTPELVTRGVFRLSRLSVRSYSKTVKKYTPQIEYRGFFETVHFCARRLWNPQNAFENFRQRFYLLWCLLVLYFWRLSQLISVQ